VTKPAVSLSRIVREYAPSGRTVGELQLDPAVRLGLRHSSEIARRAAERAAHGVVEPSHAEESGSEADLGDREPRFGEQPLGEQDAAVLRHGDGRGADLIKEQPPQVALADAEAAGKAVDRTVVERAFVNEAQRPHDNRSGAVRGGQPWGDLGPAAKTGPESRFLRGRRRREERAVAPRRRTRRTDRAAVDACAGDAGEEFAVEPRVARRNRSVADVRVEPCHALIMRQMRAWDWPFSAMVNLGL
jgi:hypothetical protein